MFSGSKNNKIFNIGSELVDYTVQVFTCMSDIIYIVLTHQGDTRSSFHSSRLAAVWGSQMDSSSLAHTCRCSMWGYHTCWCSHNPGKLGRVRRLDVLNHVTIKYNKHNKVRRQKLVVVSLHIWFKSTTSTGIKILGQHKSLRLQLTNRAVFCSCTGSSWQHDRKLFGAITPRHALVGVTS